MSLLHGDVEVLTRRVEQFRQHRQRGDAQATRGARTRPELEETEPDRDAAIGSREVALPDEVADETRDRGLGDAGGEGELRDRRRTMGLAHDLENGDDPVQN